MYRSQASIFGGTPGCELMIYISVLVVKGQKRFFVVLCWVFLVGLGFSVVLFFRLVSVLEGLG